MIKYVVVWEYLLNNDTWDYDWDEFDNISDAEDWFNELKNNPIYRNYHIAKGLNL